jgi:hypothetical protein
MALNLSTLLSGGPYPYLEYAWVTAPNTAGQSITANTITTLTLDTKVSDSGNYGSLNSNQLTLSAGTYYYEVNAPIGGTPSSAPVVIIGLYNNTSSSWISRIQSINYTGGNTSFGNILCGQFTISTSSAVTIQTAMSLTGSVGSGYYSATSLTLSTAGVDQRTTIKLWKLA